MEQSGQADQDGHGAKHVNGDGKWNEVAVYHLFTQPSDQAKPEQVDDCPRERLPMPHLHPPPKRPPQKQKRRNAGQSTEQPIDEFHPRVQGIEYRIVMLVVGDPLARRAFSFEIC